MRYFYDTEFIEDGKTIDLISIGVASEDGREFYAQNAQCDFNEASPWVQDNVFPHLIEFDLEAYAPTVPATLAAPWFNHSEIGMALREFVASDDSSLELWGYYADYDHVALCQLFGTMMDLPKGFPMWTRDIKQLCVSLGNPKLPEQGNGEHHALADARWNKVAFDFLSAINGDATKTDG